MSETVKLVLTQFTDETIMIFSLLLIFNLVGITIYWFYNRRKFQELTHEIPAVIVKNYLDSIIQNSNSLKSSLFRGGGLDVGQGIPSVVPINELPQSRIHSINETEEVSQKNAEIAALTLKLSDKQKQVSDLEHTIQDLSANKGLGAESDLLKKDLLSANNKVKELEALLKNSGSSAGGMDVEVEALKNENDELKNRLKEYAIIEGDIADLKRYELENEQLKKELAEYKSMVADRKSVSQTEMIQQANRATDDMDDLEAAMAAAIAESQAPAKTPAPETQELEIKSDNSKDEGENKSADELLSEFEKMLG